LQIVLSGQPELEEKLRDPQLRQLRQRITIRCKTMQLSREEMTSYIGERLRIAGCNGVPIFSLEAIDAVYRHSAGIPRIANLLCEHSLINAFVEQIRPVPAAVVDDVAREFELHRAELAAKHASTNGNDSAEIMDAVVHHLQMLLQELAKKNATKMKVGAADSESDS
jgi:general secretion pathway protein A